MKFEKLEALRGFAALYVVLHHFKIGAGTNLQYFTMQGQVAVMLFFVLSGFVIMYSSRNKTNYTFKEYFIKRFRRIYPVLIVALLVAYFAACLHSETWLPLDLRPLIGNLLNLQDLSRHPGYWFIAYYNNTPLWSLSYEWWFYMLFFPIFKFISVSFQKWIALAISVLGFFTYYLHPNQVSIIMEYFIIWWWGVEIAKIWIKHKNFPLIAFKFIGFSFGVMILLLFFQVYTFNDPLSFGLHPIIEIRHFLYAFVLIFIGLAWRKMNYFGYKFTFKPFLLFAPISYGVYVFHFPIIMKYDFEIYNNPIWQYIIGIAITLLLAYAIEVKLQKYINEKTNKWL